MHGVGQNPASLLAQLDRAIDAGDATFNMSGGEQLRDYLSVQEVGDRLCRLASTPSCSGIVNICSGKPISVRTLVERHLERRKARIRLNLGHYPYPDYEPMAFWGDPGKYARHCTMSNLPGT
jgi:dTDP-6-deoxy-L-talose 4-dehydrogenase (NAD+)